MKTVAHVLCKRARFAPHPSVLCKITIGIQKAHLSGFNFIQLLNQQEYKSLLRWRILWGKGIRQGVTFIWLVFFIAIHSSLVTFPPCKFLHMKETQIFFLQVNLIFDVAVGLTLRNNYKRNIILFMKY